MTADPLPLLPKDALLVLYSMIGNVLQGPPEQHVTISTSGEPR